MGSGRGGLVAATLVAFAVTIFISTAGATAAVTPTSDADALAEALDNTGSDGAVTGAALQVEPPLGNPSAVADTPLAVFPLRGSTYTMLSTGDTTAAPDPNQSDSTSTDNGGGGAGHGNDVFDLVTLRVDLDIPANRNCLTVDYRFLTEEFDEFIGSDFNDGFTAELGASTFLVSGDGSVEAPRNFALGPDGGVTTVNNAGTSADNALGTTYDGGTPVLRGTTPVEEGAESVFLSVYDASDAIFDSTVLVDNLRLRQTKPADCKLGATENPEAGARCQGKEPTVFVVDGIADGTDSDDVIIGTDEADTIRGRGGEDTICAGSGPDRVRGGPDADTIIGERGADDLRGGGGNDVVKGSRGKDEIRGQAGEDWIRGAKGHDRLYGGADSDDLYGNRGADRLFGRAGLDFLHGGRGPDNLRGGPDADNCVGGGGTDVKSGCEGGLPGGGT